MSQESHQPLAGRTIGLLIAPRGTEEAEFVEPRNTLAGAGATVQVIGIEDGLAETVNNDLDGGESYEINATIGAIDPSSLDALVVPGGTVGADTLRGDADVVHLVSEHLRRDRPAGVICHGPWLFVEADVVNGRTLTSYPSLETDIRNAGGEWVDEEVVVDDGLVTSRSPDDLDAFCDALLEVFSAIPAEQ